MSIPPLNADPTCRQESLRGSPEPPPVALATAEAERLESIAPSAQDEPVHSGNPITKAPPVQPALPLNVVAEPAQASLWRDLLRDSPSWLLSMIMHTTILLGLALWILPSAEDVRVNDLVAEQASTDDTLEELEVQPVEPVEVANYDLNAFQVHSSSDSLQEAVFPTSMQDLDASQSKVDADAISDSMPQDSSLMTEAGGTFGNGLASRGMASRAALIREGGGNEASERAVALALQWLAEHQLPDGSWNFDQRRCPNCRGKCKDQGEFAEMTNAATALALLPFLGAGQTQESGTYQKNIKAGLAYLERKMRKSRYRHRGYGSVNHGDLTDPGQGMYSHGLATIALCEAYGMTQDARLRNTAQLAVNFCVTGQDRTTGGWGYTHGNGRDTSVAGWQIMGMKSARMAYLDVPDQAFKNAYRFLDAVQADGGAFYGYRGPGRGPATSAVGLLCRMYMGWKHDNPALKRGVDAIAEIGPAQNNMYFNYYATQVMFQYTSGKGPEWEQWNTALRDYLINQQSKAGHETGSWNDCTYVMQGGRLYATCLSAMCLEVYYRHMPIYQEQAVAGGNEFPLD